MTESATAPAIDFLSAGTFATGQPHDVFRWLRENDPVHWHPEPNGPGFWVVTRHEDVLKLQPLDPIQITKVENLPMRPTGPAPDDAAALSAILEIPTDKPEEPAR